MLAEAIYITASMRNNDKIVTPVLCCQVYGLFGPKTLRTQDIAALVPNGHFGTTVKIRDNLARSVCKKCLGSEVSVHQF